MEVIRSPGGTTWGGNAVNGVINIITKKASETHGGTMVAGAGNFEQGFGTVQYGGALWKSTDYRFFGKYFNQEQQPFSSGANAKHPWHILRGGFRSASHLSQKDPLTLPADLYQRSQESFSIT